MISCLKQENFKFWHQHFPFYGMAALALFMLETAISGPIKPRIIAQGFGLGQWVILIMITISPTFLALEYKNNTIITLFYKNSNKKNIYCAKFLLTFSYGLLLNAGGFIFALGLKSLFVGDKYSWTIIYENTQDLITTLLLNIGGSIVYLLFIIALCFFLFTLIKVNVAVIGIGMALGFLGASFSQLLMDSFPHYQNLLKWNPLNMINIINQLPQVNYAQHSALENSQLLLAVLIYTLIFLGLGYQLFQNHKV
ncbi:ABC transporter permease [Lactobacillus mellis]|uniref:ABC transporter permease n=1 Tax=Bombilactobacillus mellis TaxID=1218508 RepID=UPI001580B1AC|nr:ABC transporter permease [Bombilactobacillus mellis]NUG38328.1 ABC transporter permease [Bombilactobacillus mellis]